MDRKRKANTLGGDNTNGGDAAAAAAGSGDDGDTEQQMQIIPDMLIPHILSYCNDDTLKRCACVSRSWYTMTKMRVWNEVSKLLLSHGTGKCQNVVHYKIVHILRYASDLIIILFGLYIYS